MAILHAPWLVQILPAINDRGNGRDGARPPPPAPLGRKVPGTQNLKPRRFQKSRNQLKAKAAKVTAKWRIPVHVDHDRVFQATIDKTNKTKAREVVRSGIIRMDAKAGPGPYVNSKGAVLRKTTPTPIRNTRFRRLTSPARRLAILESRSDG
jgi:hypothetical protein